MSVNRLFETVYYLMEHDQTTAKQLAEHFEVSVRTVYRDLERLMVAGFPICTSQGVKGGIYLDNDFVLDKTTFTDDEQMQILSALQTIEGLQAKDDIGLIDKMAALFKKNKVDWIEVDFSTWHKDNQLNEKFDLLKQAILTQVQVNFTYINTQGVKSTRTVFPSKLFFKSNTWYLQGYCLDKEDYRVFRLSRIIDLNVTKETFILTTMPPKINNYPIIKQDPMAVTLQFDKRMGSVVYDEFSDAKITIDEHGNYLVETIVYDDNWLLSFIISFGAMVKIMAPQSLQLELLQELDKIKSLYD